MTTARGRSLARLVARRALRLIGWALLRVVPPGSHVVVHAEGDREENGLRLATALAAAGLDVIWLRDEPGAAVPAPLAALRAVPHHSAAGYCAYLRARGVVFTHGLYGSPESPRNRVFVNAWHGDGPKGNRHPGDVSIRSTIALTGAMRFGVLRAAEWGMPAERVLATGTPRSDALAEATDAAALARLGLDGPLILWLPTWRGVAVPPPPVAWPPDAGRRPQLVVKPHPRAPQRDWGDWRVVTDAELAAGGLSLYGLLAASAALVTDESSVWTEYLVLDRPVGLWLAAEGAQPDADRAARPRLLAPDWLRHAPGRRIDAVTPALLDPVPDAALRADARRYWGVTGGDGGSTRRAVDWIVAALGSGDRAGDDAVAARIRAGTTQM